MKSGKWIVSVIGAVACGEMHSTPVGQLPTSPAGSGTTSTEVATFAIDALFVGDTSFDGVASGDAWKSFGYDLDGIATTKTSAACTIPNPDERGDGLGGIDNAWGASFLHGAQLAVGGGFLGPQTSTGSWFAWASPSSDATTFIQSGAWTLQLRVAGLSTEAAQTATGLDTQVFIGSALNGVTFRDSTSWPVAPSSLTDGATLEGGARVHFGTSYIVEGTLVAKDSAEPLVVPIVFHNGGSQICMLGGCNGPNASPVAVPLTLRIHHPVLTFVRADASTLTHGIIAGVLDTAELTEAALLAYDLGPEGKPCDAEMRAALAQAIGSMQDIVHDATNTSGAACDAISIGLGFTATRIANPTAVGTDVPPLADVCE